MALLRGTTADMDGILDDLKPKSTNSQDELGKRFGAGDEDILKIIFEGGTVLPNLMTVS